jgi:hypothetical protein
MRGDARRCNDAKEAIMRNAMLAMPALLAAGAATIAGSGPVVAIDYPYCIQGRGWGVPGGVYREVVPNQRLAFSWAWHSTPERESLVTISLKPDGDGTLLTLHHEKFFDQAACDGHERGWIGMLDKLEKYIA